MKGEAFAAWLGDIWTVAPWAAAGGKLTTPTAYPSEFRDDVVAVAHRREDGVTIKQIAEDLRISEACMQNWLCKAEVKSGRRRWSQRSCMICASVIGYWSRSAETELKIQTRFTDIVQGLEFEHLCGGLDVSIQRV